MRVNTARGLGLLLALAMTLSAAVPAEAGLLDSIKKLFGGGSSSAAEAVGSNGQTLTQLLDQVEQSQKAVSDKQQALAPIYNGSASAIQPGDTALQGKLNELAQVSRANEQLYLSLLQTRADLTKQGKDVGSAAERIAKITTTQNQLEANYQKIQEINQQAGFFKAPAASETAPGGVDGSGAAGGAGAGPIWLQPLAQRYIDEYLAKVHLNEWGIWEGQSGTTVVKSAASPDAAVGRNRYEVVWMMLHKDSCHSSMTLEDYVRARLEGDNPEISYNPPEGPSLPPPPQTPGGGGTSAGGVAASAVAAPAAPRPSLTVTNPQVADIQQTTTPQGETAIADLDNQLKDSYDRFAQLQKSGQGGSEKAKALLKRIESLNASKASAVRNAQGK